MVEAEGEDTVVTTSASHFSAELSSDDQRCPFLALWVHPVPANRRKVRHKAKARSNEPLLRRVLDLATSRNERQSS